MIAIEMIGGVYCPLSPRDPQHRLHTLIQQTQSHLVLVHHLTKPLFNDIIISLDIDSVVNNKDVKSDIDVIRLSNVIVIPENISYIIFTSGSTGTPKTVCHGLVYCYLSLISVLCYRFKFGIETSPNRYVL
jgi:non-ribosomal peptide synthetase component F